MSTRLVILGLLKDKPLYGYELKHIIESHMGDWTNIAFGSIYFALKKLTEEKLVKELAREQDGNRPSRRVYELTIGGLSEFDRLLYELWSTGSREYYPLDIGLFFLPELPEEKRLPLIRNRIAETRKSLAYLKEHRKQMIGNPDIPAQANAIFAHTLYHLEAELTWLDEVEVSVASGVYP